MHIPLSAPPLQHPRGGGEEGRKAYYKLGRRKTLAFLCGNIPFRRRSQLEQRGEQANEGFPKMLQERAPAKVGDAVEGNAFF